MLKLIPKPMFLHYLPVLIAGAVTQFTDPGRYDWLSIVLGLTLFLVVASFVVWRERKSYQLLAVWAVLAFTILPLIGAAVDFWIQLTLEQEYRLARSSRRCSQEIIST